MKTSNLEGPILVLGAGGFVGLNLRKRLREKYTDVIGLYRKNNIGARARDLFALIKPRVIFDCIAYGGYLHQTDVAQIYQTNVLLKRELLELAAEYGTTYIHLGSSSEYGEILDGPGEEEVQLLPNTDYSASKIAASNLIHYFGRHRGLRCANLRLYAVYGPHEPPTDRLIPQVMLRGLEGKYPPFVNRHITRDFIHVDDVCEAMVRAAEVDVRGESFNIGTGKATPMLEVAAHAKALFGLKGLPSYSLEPFRSTDVPRPWFANTNKAKKILGWEAKLDLWQGLNKTLEWYKEQE